MHDRVAFMQGRLSPIERGKIQSFPWTNWENEIKTAAKLGFKKMEWTLDQDNLYLNPLMTALGQEAIKNILAKTDLKVPSLTGDCFMQQPFWKCSGEIRSNLERDFLRIVECCKIIGINLIVVPLVDNGSLKNKKQEDYIVFDDKGLNLFVTATGNVEEPIIKYDRKKVKQTIKKNIKKEKDIIKDIIKKGTQTDKNNNIDPNVDEEELEFIDWDNEESDE